MSSSVNIQNLKLYDQVASFIITENFQNLPGVAPSRRQDYNKMLMLMWNQLKAGTNQGMRNMMSIIERKSIESNQDGNKDQNSILEESVNILFYRFSEECDTKSLFGDIIPVSKEGYAHVHQKWKDDALWALWDKSVCPVLGDSAPHLTTLEEVRVWFADPEQQVKLAPITELHLYQSGLRIVPSEIVHCNQLKKLNFNGNQIRDIDCLSSLTQLTWLGLGRNPISDIRALGSLTQLTELGLEDCRISDIRAFDSLTQLTRLALNHNRISDIRALGSLTQLTDLSLHFNNIRDIHCLGSLTQLTDLGLHSNNIGDIHCLGSLTRIRELDLSCNQISETPDFSSLTLLRNLNLDNNQIPKPSRVPSLTLRKYNGTY